MKLLTCYGCLLALAAASVCTGAETKFDAAARAKAVSPIVDEETAIVAHVDLSRMSPELLIGFLSGVLPNTLAEVRRSQGQLQGWCDALLHVGVKDVYFTITPRVLYGSPKPGQLSWVLAFSSAQQEKAVRMVLPLKDEEWKKADGVLVIPPYPYLGRGLPSVERPELIAAFEAAGDTAAQFILIPPADTQRVVGELMPQLPRELGGGPTSVLTHGIRWAATGIDLAPKRALRLVIKSQDAQAAEASSGPVDRYGPRDRPTGGSPPIVAGVRPGSRHANARDQRRSAGPGY